MDLRHSKATLISLGAVDTTGVPAVNQVARFFDADTVQGSPNLLFTGSVLSLTGSQNISSFLALGATPALSGTIRLSNTDAIAARSSANNQDLNLFSFGNSDEWEIGDTNMPLISFAQARVQFRDIVGFDSSLHLGGSVAGTGTIRLNNAFSIVARNATNDGDLNLLSLGDSDLLELGDVNMAGGVFIRAELEMRNKIRIETNNFQALRVRSFSPFVNSFVVDTVADEVELGPNTALQWSTDLKLFRDGPWELALRDGLNDNFFYVYGTFTDSSNYERLALYAGASLIHFLEPQSAGTGDNNINLTVRQLGSAILTLGNVASGGNVDIKIDNVLNVIDRFNGFTRIIHKQLDADMSSGSSVTLAGAIPAGVLVLAVTARVRTGVTGPTGFDIGDGIDVDRWGNSIPVGLGNQVNIGSYTSTALTYFPTANDVVITSDGVDFTGGEIRVMIHYMAFITSSVDL